MIKTILLKTLRATGGYFIGVFVICSVFDYLQGDRLFNAETIFLSVLTSILFGLYEFSSQYRRLKNEQNKRDVDIEEEEEF